MTRYYPRGHPERKRQAERRRQQAERAAARPPGPAPVRGIDTASLQRFGQEVADGASKLTADALVAQVNTQLASIIPARDASVAATARAQLLAELAEQGRLRSRPVATRKRVIRGRDGLVESIEEEPM